MPKIHIGLITGDHYTMECESAGRAWTLINDQDQIEITNMERGGPIHAVLNPIHVVIVNELPS